MSRAQRRHHTERMKARYRRKERLHPYWRSDDPASAGKYANHGCTCSCWMCGNPRRHLGELTMQERRANGAGTDLDSSVSGVRADGLRSMFSAPGVDQEVEQGGI